MDMPKTKKYNCIIVDSTDPVNQGKNINIKKIYRYLSLTKAGVIIQQSGSPIKDNKTIEPLKKKYKDLGFLKISVINFPMPLYLAGNMVIYCVLRERSIYAHAVLEICLLLWINRRS